MCVCGEYFPMFYNILCVYSENLILLIDIEDMLYFTILWYVFIDNLILLFDIEDIQYFTIFWCV